MIKLVQPQITDLKYRKKLLKSLIEGKNFYEIIKIGTII